ncbi:peptidogalycan biosysnthesis protein [Streptomyces sp. NPDC057257]|uniref:peptidogalycan biosysnthesis protein n=1 Tax=Streptomyces sp. NPDC057257 TaxID=3346071 RepID=UPI003642FC72
MKTRIVGTLHEVPEPDWDRLARPAGLYLSHRWLLGQEPDPTATPSYALVTDDDGTLLAAAPLYLVHSEPNDFYVPDPPGPRVLAGARRGYQNAPLTHPGLTPTRRTACLALLRDCARAHAERHGTTHWWPYLTEAAAGRLAEVYDGAVPRRLEDDATIPLPGNGFEDYLASLPSKRRVAIRHERAAFQASGLTVRHEPLSTCYREAGALLAALQHAHGHPGDDIDPMTRLLGEQAEAMDEQAHVTAAYDGRHMAAFSLYYHFGDTTWLRACGTAPSCPAPFAYFNLTYYLPIEAAYRHGTTALHAGMKTIQAKRLRGARITALFDLR